MLRPKKRKKPIDTMCLDYNRGYNDACKDWEEYLAWRENCHVMPPKKKLKVKVKVRKIKKGVPSE